MIDDDDDEMNSAVLIFSDACLVWCLSFDDDDVADDALPGGVLQVPGRGG